MTFWFPEISKPRNFEKKSRFVRKQPWHITDTTMGTTRVDATRRRIRVTAKRAAGDVQVLKATKVAKG